jgi:hypothetical protein
MLELARRCTGSHLEDLAMSFRLSSSRLNIRTEVAHHQLAGTVASVAVWEWAMGDEIQSSSLNALTGRKMAE